MVRLEQSGRGGPRLAMCVSAALTLALAVQASIPQTSTSQVRVPARPPDYDLAIVGVAPGWRWQGGLEEFARLDVALTNQGVRDILNEDVACTMAGKTLVALNAGRAITHGEVYHFTVQLKGYDAWTIKPGRYPIECKASIVRPADARDGAPDNDTFRTNLTVEPPPRPDLALQSLVLRECETRGPALGGHPACVEVTYVNGGGGIITPWTIACDVEGKKATSDGVSPMEKGAVLMTVVAVGDLAPGEHQADCVLDAGHALTETDTSNNRRVETVLVLPDTAEVRYDLAVTRVGTTVSESRDPATNQPYLWMEITLKNLGTQPILQADARCDLGATGIAFVAQAGDGLEAGEERTVKVQAWGRRLGQVPGGTYETTCAAGIVQPPSIVETSVENNVLTGSVVVRR